MAGFLDIKQGGRIRYNFVTALGQTWNRGQVLVLNSASQLELLAAGNYAAGVLCGLALESCVSATTGNLIQNTAVVIAGSTGSVLLGESVVINDNLSGSGGWTPGVSKVYGQIGGNLSYNSASGLQVGTCLETPVTNGRLKFLYRPNVGN